MKKYHRVLLVYFNTYAGTFRTNNALLFDKLDEKKQLMQLANVWKLLKDHYLDEFITIKEVQRIVQKLNAANKTFKDSLLIDFDLF